MYRYKVIEMMLPHDIALVVYSYNWKKREEITQTFQRSLFCIEYYGIQNNIWRNNKLIPIRELSRGISEYVNEELTQKNRNDTINMLRNFRYNS
jgi:hypothetical protein